MRDIVCGTDADSYVEDVRSPGGSAGLGPVSGLWRSEEMELRSMSIERSVLERVARQLGELGCVEFKDLNAVSEEELREVDKKPAPRYFHTPIRTCEAIERILRVFEAQLAAHNISLADYTSNPAECPPLGVDEFRKVANITSLPNALETLRVKLQADEASLLDQVGKLEAYTQEYDSAIEEASVLEWAQVTCNDTLAANQRVLDEAADDITARSRSDEASSSALGQLIGVIDSGKLDTFHRLLYRVTKGHAVLKTDSVKDLDDKTVFRILYSSFEMQSRILKLIQSNGSTIYLVRPLSSYSGNSEPRLDGIHVLPSSPSAFGELQRKVYDDTSEREKLIHSTSSQVTELLTSLARVHRERRHYVVKEKALFHCLNMMKIDKGASFATAVAWIPSRFVPKVRAVVEAQHLCGLGKETLDVTEADVPPTYFETNDFTGTFQGIIDSYGVPRYREINPVAFTIVTFPWLFGLMYGDVGHGLMIVLGSVVMIYNQQTMKSMNLNEIVDMIFGARWLLLLMGLFATYIGLLYNDTFAMMFEYSESRFLFPDGWTEAGAGKDTCFYQGGSSTGLLPLLCAPCSINELVMVTMGDGSQRCTCPFAYVLPSALMASEYSCPNFVNGTGPLASTNFMAPSNGPTPFGMDAAWHEADNKLTFMNSFKMKNAVIVGVLQMSLGLFLSLGNHLHFGDWKRIYFGFIPECMFLFCTFGYMCVMLIAKWLTPWPNTSIAPNVLESMTNFFLSPGHYNLYSDEKCAAGDCSGYVYLYSAQMEVQVVLIIIAFAAVPLMLIPIPVLKGRENARIEKRAMMMGEEPVGLVDMQEVWIKQVIHTIEFVLGCVSNTASYLRLWALSLAHAELSEVFWSFAIMKMLDGADDVSGGVIMYLGFGAWLSATIGVLIIMEALSAFLHSLRLHWVEYQTKFYVGDGRKFTPLNFAELVAESDVQTS